jgi:hypothetical protein
MALQSGISKGSVWFLESEKCMCKLIVLGGKFPRGQTVIINSWVFTGGQNTWKPRMHKTLFSWSIGT